MKTTDRLLAALMRVPVRWVFVIAGYLAVSAAGAGVVWVTAHNVHAVWVLKP
jgi:hypothetical protein